MDETFDKLNIIERRAAEEKEFNEWVNANKKRAAKYGTVVDDINNEIKRRAEFFYVYKYLNETVSAVELVKATTRRPAQVDDFYKDYSVETDKKLAKAMYKIYRERLPQNTILLSMTGLRRSLVVMLMLL